MATPSMNVTVIGDGGWGTALALRLHGNGHAVRVWGPSEGYLDELVARRENVRYLPGVSLPDDILFTADPAEAAKGAQCVVIAIPSPFCAAVCTRFHGLFPYDILAVSTTKGLDESRLCRTSVLARDLLGISSIAVLAGPGYSIEVAAGLPACFVAAAADPRQAQAVRQLFNGPAFRVGISSDALGSELGGVIANVVAVAAGMADGLGLGEGARSAIAARGLAELVRLGIALGARPGTFMGLCGIGDIMATCSSPRSRNRAAGEQISNGASLGDLQKDGPLLAEGILNARVAALIARRLDVTMPVSDAVNRVCAGMATPKEAIGALLALEEADRN